MDRAGAEAQLRTRESERVVLDGNAIVQALSSITASESDPMMDWTDVQHPS
jgi:hypothetical protein